MAHRRISQYPVPHRCCFTVVPAYIQKNGVSYDIPLFQMVEHRGQSSI